MSEKITLSVIKADVGGYVGHSAMHPDLLTEARRHLETAQQQGLLIDFHVTACGDDLELIMTHRLGVDNQQIHRQAWDIFEACTAVARGLKLYGAGQDLLADALSGNVKGMGPGVAEMEFEERKSEPIIIFMADKTSAGAWNLPLFKIFADPFNTAGLIIAPTMHEGFRFEVHDVKASKRIFFDAPGESYDLLVFIGATGRYIVKGVYGKDGEIASVSSTQRLALIAGKYVGKDDPVCIVRCQGNFRRWARSWSPLPCLISWRAGCGGPITAPCCPCPWPGPRPVASTVPPGLLPWVSSWPMGVWWAPGTCSMTPASTRRAKCAMIWRTTCGAMGRLSPIACPWRKWSTPPCPRSWTNWRGAGRPSE